MSVKFTPLLSKKIKIKNKKKTHQTFSSPCEKSLATNDTRPSGKIELVLNSLVPTIDEHKLNTQLLIRNQVVGGTDSCESIIYLNNIFTF